MTDESLVYSVSELTDHIQQALTDLVPHGWIRGEISNYMAAQSGHLYFSLKDTHSQIRCVIWKTTVLSLPGSTREQLRNGNSIDIRGALTIYKPRGEYQIIVKQIKTAGQGALYARYLALKEQLQKEGLFSPRVRPPCPQIPDQIGIITSLKAAGLRDILVTLRRNRPSLRIVLYPCQVQGEQAAPSIAQAIEVANKRAEVPVLILARGGGSLEDLWCFNEEMVVRAVYNSSIPIVTGIGHESDMTLSDLAAHTRAATPTAAAQHISLTQAEINQQYQHYKTTLQNSIQRLLMHRYQQKDLYEAKLKQHHAMRRVQQQKMRLAQQYDRLRYVFTRQQQQTKHTWHHLRTKLQQRCPDPARLQERINKNRMALKHVLATLMISYRNRYAHDHQQLHALNPKAVLSRGYSITVTQACPTVPITRETPLQEGDTLLSLFDWGQITSTFRTRS